MTQKQLYLQSLELFKTETPQIFGLNERQAFVLPETILMISPTMESSFNYLCRIESLCRADGWTGASLTYVAQATFCVGEKFRRGVAS